MRRRSRDRRGCRWFRRLARDHGADYVADGERVGAFRFGFALSGDRVGGFTGLRNDQSDRAGIDDGIAVAAPFAGVVNLDGDAGERLDHELAGLSGVPTGAGRPRC